MCYQKAMISIAIMYIHLDQNTMFDLLIVFAFTYLRYTHGRCIYIYIYMWINIYIYSIMRNRVICVIWLCEYCVLWKEQMESFNHWNSNVVMVTTLRFTTSALIVIIETRGAAGSRGWSPWLSFSFLKTVTVPVTIYDSFLPCPFLLYTCTYVYSA